MAVDTPDPLGAVLKGNKELARGIFKSSGPLIDLPQDEYALDRYSASSKGPTLIIACFDSEAMSQWLEIFYPLNRGSHGFAPIIGRVEVVLDEETEELAVEDDPLFLDIRGVADCLAIHGAETIEVSGPVIRQMAKHSHYKGSGKTHRAGADGLEEAMADCISATIAGLRLQDTLLRDAQASRPDFYY